jgi:hypothetical protein
MVINNSDVEMFDLMIMQSPLSCPCEKACKKRREPAVNLLLKHEICTTVELKGLLNQESFGEYAARKNVEFLCSKKCDLIEIFEEANEQKALIFGRQGKLLYVKTISQEQLKEKVNNLLSKLQKRILQKFSELNQRIFYFSMYDLKRLIPASGNIVEYSLFRLIKLGLITRVYVEKTDFYVLTSQVWRIETDKQSIAIDDMVEFAVVKIVHELIMNLYPINIMFSYHDAIRPRSRETLTITGGMTFDIFYQLRENVMDKKYLAVDVYTRFPVTGFTVNSFVKKIDWARTREKGKITSYLTGNTYGMMIFRNATPGAIRKANSLGIRFLRLSDIKVDYTLLYEKIKAEFLKNPVRIS